VSRHKDVDWRLPDKLQQWDQVNTAILMDIRDELRRLNALLHCANFTEIPHTLKAIRRKMPTPRPRRKKNGE
jgi:hypothetical protein